MVLSSACVRLAWARVEQQRGALISDSHDVLAHPFPRRCHDARDVASWGAPSWVLLLPGPVVAGILSSTVLTIVVPSPVVHMSRWMRPLFKQLLEFFARRVSCVEDVPPPLSSTDAETMADDMRRWYHDQNLAFSDEQRASLRTWVAKIDAAMQARGDGPLPRVVAGASSPQLLQFVP